MQTAALQNTNQGTLLPTLRIQLPVTERVRNTHVFNWNYC